MILLQSVDLQPLNTLAVPSRAQFFAKATSPDEIRQALSWARKKNVSAHVLGGGSNTLLPDTVAGLVIQPAVRGVELIENLGDSVVVKAGAGENWHRFVQYCLQKKYYGLENLISIPGLVGAAPIQNIGAYGVELKDVFERLDAIECRTGKTVSFDRSSCEFGYRESIFKGRCKQQYIVTHVYFRLQKEARLTVHYPALKAFLGDISERFLTAELVANAVTELRREKLPLPESMPNCGSFFKNPVVSSDALAHLKLTYPDVVSYDIGGGQHKLAAGWLIEKVGWKGRSSFNAAVHNEQALVLTNPNKMPVKNVLQLAASVKRSVNTYFGVELEIEPQLLAELKL